VLLVDFVDRPSRLQKEHYETCSSRARTIPPGLARLLQGSEFGQGELSGSVDGWFRMPQPYSYYRHGDSGTEKTYPHQPQKLAEDAVTARSRGRHFEDQLDNLETARSPRSSSFTGAARK